MIEVISVCVNWMKCRKKVAQNKKPKRRTSLGLGLSLGLVMVLVLGQTTAQAATVGATVRSAGAEKTTTTAAKTVKPIKTTKCPNMCGCVSVCTSLLCLCACVNVIVFEINQIVAHKCGCHKCQHPFLSLSPSLSLSPAADHTTPSSLLPMPCSTACCDASCLLRLAWSSCRDFIWQLSWLNAIFTTHCSLIKTAGNKLNLEICHYKWNEIKQLQDSFGLLSVILIRI